MRDPLYRSRTDRVIGGLAAGLARSLGVDVTWVRLGWVVLAFLTQGIAILIYVVLLFVIPEEPAGYMPPGGATPSGSAPGGSAPGGSAPGAGPAGWTATAEPGEGAIPGWTAPGSAGFADTTSATAMSGAPGTVGESPVVAPTPPPPPSPLERWVGGGARGDSSRTAALIVGLVLVAVGAWLLIRRYVLIDFDLGWPVVALGLGAILVLAALRTGRES